MVAQTCIRKVKCAKGRVAKRQLKVGVLCQWEMIDWWPLNLTRGKALKKKLMAGAHHMLT